MTKEQAIERARKKAELHGGTWYAMQRGAHDFKVIDERTKREIFWAVVAEVRGEGLDALAPVETGGLDHGL